jgi:hypothetical protein
LNGKYGRWVSTVFRRDPISKRSELLVKILPAALSLGINDCAFERAVLLLAERLRYPTRDAARCRPRGCVRITRGPSFGTTLRA